MPKCGIEENRKEEREYITILQQPLENDLEETIDPEQAIDRALETYLKKDYSEECA